MFCFHFKQAKQMPAHFGYLPPSFMISATAVSSPFFQMVLKALPSTMLSQSDVIWVDLMTCHQLGSGFSTQLTSANGCGAIILKEK